MGQAGWLVPRLAPWRADPCPVTAVVPVGFEAYARVLHPAATPDGGGPLVRWRDVAAWSGRPLRRDAQFHSIALPPDDPGSPRPGAGQLPQQGSLWAPDAEAIAALARDWTATPDDCWFCVWDGFGWAGDDGGPVPPGVTAGPRVTLAERSYLLYGGPAEDVAALAGLPGTGGQCPSLWWPADRAWCVATDIDLPWSYLAGPRGLIDAVLASDTVEALPSGPDDPTWRVEDWVRDWAGQLAGTLLERGEGALRTPGGTVRAALRRPRRQPGAADLEITISGPGTQGGSVHPGLRGGEDKLRRELTRYLTLAILELE